MIICASTARGKSAKDSAMAGAKGNALAEKASDLDQKSAKNAHQEIEQTRQGSPQPVTVTIHARWRCPGHADAARDAGVCVSAP